MALLNQSDQVGTKQLHSWLSAVMGWVFDYYEITLLTFLVIPISAHFRLSAGQSAYFFSLDLLGIAVGGVIFGFLADRIGRRVTLTWTISIYAVFTLARAFAPNYDMLLALTVVAGIGLGGEYGVGQALVSEVMPFRRRGWWSGMLYSGASIGAIIAVLVGAYLLPHIGWRWVFGLSSLPILLVLYVRAKAPESDVWESRRDKARTNWRLLYRPVFIWPFFLCLLAGSMEFFAYYGTAAFLPTYFIKVVGFSFSKTAMFTILIYVAIFIGCVAGSYTSDRWGRRITWTYLSAIAAIGGLILGLSWNNVKSDVILIPFFIFYFGTGVAAMFGSVFSEQFTTEIRSFGVSSSLQIGRGISYFPPIIAAAIYPVHGYRVLIFGGAVLYVILAGLGWAFKEGRNKAVHQIDGARPADTAGREPVGGPTADGSARLN